MNSIREIKGQCRVRADRLQSKIRSIYAETLAVPDDATEDAILYPLLYGPNMVTGPEFEVLVKQNPLWEQYRSLIERRDRRHDKTGRFIGKGL